MWQFGFLSNVIRNIYVKLYLLLLHALFILKWIIKRENTVLQNNIIRYELSYYMQ